MSQVNVAVGVIYRDDHIFVCLRPEDKHQGGKWEFPGGKIDAGESVVEALTRELDEEVDIRVQEASHLIDIAHDYGDKQVVLHVYMVTRFTGEPHGKEGQQGKWLAKSALVAADFPAANVAIIEALNRL